MNADFGSRKTVSSSPLAPVEIREHIEDSVTHSLRILASVYNYNHWIFSMVRGFLGDSVLEVGSGIGNITQFMLNVDRLACLEPDMGFSGYLRKRFAEHLNVRVVNSRIEDCPNADVPANSFDTVVCLNVLEHIEDDAGALRNCRQLLRPKGRLVLLVPALPFIYGEMDRAMGHFRRYTRHALKARLREADFEVSYSRYMNVVGIAGWWWQGCLRKKPYLSESGSHLFDRCVPLLSATEEIAVPIVGQSLVMVGVKSAEPEAGI